jgi:outer membrane protein, multidrug efflux system
VEKLLVSEEYKNFVTTQLVSDIASAYYELIVKDNELVFLDENINLQSRGLDIVEVLKQSGQANQLAIDLFKGQLLASQTIKKEVELEILLLENKINLLVGRFPQKINRPTIELNQLNLPKFNAGIPSSMLLNRPDLRMAERELIVSKADLEVARLAFYPNLNLTAGLGLQAFRPSVILNPGSLAANTFGSLLSPWINRRVLEADLMASKASQKMAYINYDRTVLTAFTEVNTSLKTIDNVSERFGLKLEEVEVLRNSIQASNELYRSGRATYLEVVTAQKNALQSQIELTNVRKDQINAIISLYRSLGGGWQ